MFPRHHRPINSNINTLADFPLPCLRKVLRIESWFQLDDDFFNQHRVVDILHTLHITVYMMWPVTHFPLSARSDDENYDVRAILHQGCRESLVRFSIETIVCIINAFKARSSAFESRQNITTCISVVPGKFPTFMTSFLTLWHHPPEGPFSPDGSHMFGELCTTQCTTVSLPPPPPCHFHHCIQKHNLYFNLTQL